LVVLLKRDVGLWVSLLDQKLLVGVPSLCCRYFSKCLLAFLMLRRVAVDSGSGNARHDHTRDVSGVEGEMAVNGEVDGVEVRMVGSDMMTIM
jgi:hypothetical protein